MNIIQHFAVAFHFDETQPLLWTVRVLAAIGLFFKISNTPYTCNDAENSLAGVTARKVQNSGHIRLLKQNVI